MTKTLPIPGLTLDRWALPPGWQQQATIYVANSDRVEGTGTPIIAMPRERTWTFTALAEWVPAQYRDSGQYFCRLSLKDFRTILIGKIVGEIYSGDIETTAARDSP